MCSQLSMDAGAFDAQKDAEVCRGPSRILRIAVCAKAITVLLQKRSEDGLVAHIKGRVLSIRHGFPDPPSPSDLRVPSGSVALGRDPGLSWIRRPGGEVRFRPTGTEQKSPGAHPIHLQQRCAAPVSKREVRQEEIMDGQTLAPILD